MTSPLRIFISSSRKDEDWSARLETHLKPIERMGKVSVWKDTEIQSGDSWNDSISQAIDNSDLAILIISPDFLSSSWLMDCEFLKLHRRYQDGALSILPIIARPSVWKIFGSLSEFQVCPKDGKPLSLLTEPEIELEFAKIATDIFHRSEQLNLKIESNPSSKFGIYNKKIEDNIFYQVGKSINIGGDKLNLETVEENDDK